MNKSVDTVPEGTTIGLWSAVSIGIGGMVGGAIFSVLGLAVQLAGGSVPIAFFVGGIVALITSYSYAKLSVKFPDNGGTVEFLNQAFGRGVFAGGLNTLLFISYVVVLALYAYAFGSYGASFFSSESHELWRHILLTSVVIILTVVNLISMGVVVESENIINALKLVILFVFVVGGFIAGIRWERMDVSQWAPPLEIISGGMIIFVNYEGFELISNAAKNVVDRERIIPLAHYISVLLVVVLYVLIAMVSVGQLSPQALVAARDYALASSAAAFLGHPGFVLIAVAALLATASAINATLYSSPRITFTMAKEGEMPQFLEDVIWGIPAAGLIIIVIVTILVANFLDLRSISTVASAGFLLVFASVNLANVRLAGQTGSRRWISTLGVLSCLGALVAICSGVYSNPDTRWELWILFGMVALSFAAEIIYLALRKPAKRP
jgi:hypothetical protein